MTAAPKLMIDHARPDIVVIGAMRAGTTTLYNLLDQVENIAVPSIKETNFFFGDQSNDQSGWDWYAKLFDPNADIRCDISPNYAKRSLDPHVASRIAAANPNAKIAFIARDPVQRAISQYAHSFHSGQNLPLPSELSETPEGQHIISTSKYAYCLEPFREQFGDQLEILDFADLVNEPDEFLQSLVDQSEVDLEMNDVTASVQNSSEDLAREPKWWGKLRESQFGDTLRRHVPREHALRIKDLVTKAWPKRQVRAVPEFSEDDKQRLIDALAEDVAEFRKTYGKPFSDWCL